MKQKNHFLSTVIITALLFSCSGDESETPAPLVRALSVNEAEIATSANNFTFDLMAKIDADFGDENYFISSFSISTAISMVMNAGSLESQQAFIKTLGLEGMSSDQINAAYQSLVSYIYTLDPSVTLNVANSNWYSQEYTIQDDFANTLRTYYDAELFESDFADPATLQLLNGWVEAETNGKIKNILDGINPEDVMFLINAIYFKAIWTNQFDPKNTSEQSFTLQNSQSVNASTMMAPVKHWWSYDKDLGVQIIEIPYGNENYGFTILMPDDPSQITNLISSLDVNWLNALLADSTTVTRDLYLPKFQIDFKANLVNILSSMGMPRTGLDNLFEEPLPLAISKVIHQSFLEVNEEGSEAAAATVIGVELTSLPAATHIDQPFVFLIRERNSGTILFSGKLLDPR
ncbi:MAG: serpin family protein [Bacteroidota bacterium]